MWRYLGYSLVPHVLFAAFALSWVATRLVYFPIFVIWNIYIEPPKVRVQLMHIHVLFMLLSCAFWYIVCWQSPETAFLNICSGLQLAIKYGVELYPHRNIFLALLSTLLVLHIYW